MSMLYHFEHDCLEAVDLTTITDEEAVQFIPQHPVTQSLYTLFRAQGYRVIEAMTEVLRIQMVSGGQRKVVQGWK